MPLFGLAQQHQLILHVRHVVESKSCHTTDRAADRSTNEAGCKKPYENNKIDRKFTIEPLENEKVYETFCGT